MRALGYALLIGGFLAAAFSTALDTRATDWLLFLPAAVVAVAGVLLLKRQARSAARAGDRLSENRSDLKNALENILRELDAMTASDLPVAGLREEIDRRLRDDLRRFADARESLVHLFGLQVYADIMSDFAAGERYVNRVWSASADGYGDEARRYVRRAVTRFRAAQETLAEAERAP